MSCFAHVLKIVSLLSAVLLVACGSSRAVSPVETPAAPEPATETDGGVDEEGTGIAVAERELICRIHVPSSVPSSSSDRPCISRALQESASACQATASSEKPLGFADRNADLFGFASSELGREWRSCFPGRDLCRDDSSLLNWKKVLSETWRGEQTNPEYAHHLADHFLHDALSFQMLVIGLEDRICREPYEASLAPDKMRLQRIVFLKVSSAAAENAKTAIELFLRAYPDDPRGEKMPFTLGVLDWLGATQELPGSPAGELDPSIRRFEEQREKYPESRLAASAVAMIAGMALTRGDFGAALAACDSQPKVSAAVREGLFVSYFRAHALWGLGRYDEAVAAWESVAKNDLQWGNDSTSNLYFCVRAAALELASAYSSLGDCTKAAELLSRLRESGVGDCTEAAAVR
ncbi:MAG: hypothetical protein M0R80_14245 [Proteobacteria bacterium]|jgi:hypothetical protein|nr:hypothetical protein [Pseudomonadota bacterium]